MTHKILIADDDPVYLDLLKSEFNHDDEQIIIAEDGKQAIEKIKSAKPDVVILDIMLPQILGLTVLEKIRQADDTKHLPVIAVSNFGGDPNKQRALDMGANQFLTKAQFTITQIAEAARKLLPEN